MLKSSAYLAGDSSYTTDSLLYDEVVQQLIYESDSGINEEMISKTVPQNESMWTLRLASKAA